MSYSNQKVIGVWMDHKSASLISTLDKGVMGEFSIQEKILNKHHSDHGSNESVHNHKMSNEMHKYFEDVSKHLTGYDSILLFGHGIAQEQFHNFLNDHKGFNGKEIVVKSGGRMTDHEVIAFVRNAFKV
jgi:stalled ribosome rescue protein Dom34